MADRNKQALAELYVLLQSQPFLEEQQPLCGLLAKRWQSKYRVEASQLAPLLVQFCARMNHAVRINNISYRQAADLLSRLIVLTDFEIPRQLVVVATALSQVAQRQAAGELTDPAEAAQALQSGLVQEADHLYGNSLKGYSSTAIQFSNRYRLSRSK